MIQSLFYKQKKPLTALILGYILLVVLFSLLVTNSGPLNQHIVLGIITFFLIGYSISYEVYKDFILFKHLKVFGITLFKSKIHFPFPDYLIVFSATYKQGAEWGSVAAIGKERGGDNYVIRLFKGNKHFTIYRTNSLEDAKEKASELSVFLNVEIRGKK